MKPGGFTARPADYWSRRAWDRKLEADEKTTTGPASDVRRIDPQTGEVIENIKSEAAPRSTFGRRTRRS